MQLDEWWLIEPDDVRLSGFTRDTYQWLREILDERWGVSLKDFSAKGGLIQFEVATALLWLLRVAPDDVFPSGKWATIQHLEDRIEAALDG